MTNTDPRREAVRHLDQQIELCSRSYASARVARDPEGQALLRSRYLDLETKVREAEADYLAPKNGNPTPEPPPGDCGVANMTIHYDLEAIREAEMYSDEPVEKPCRYAVIGCLLVAERGFERDVTICETDDLGLARIVADLESHCAGPDGWDSAVVYDQYQGREVPAPLHLIRGGRAA